jgi:hypothetical protein
VATESKARLGTYVTTSVAGEQVQAFIPPALPPNSPLELGALYADLDRANQALGQLDDLTTLLPDTKFFLYLYIRKEALLSSQIEGTQSSFTDLLLFENKVEPDVPIDDVEEVSNCVAAMQHGLRRIAGGFPCRSGSFARFTPFCCVVGGEPTELPVSSVDHKTGWGDSPRECFVCSASARAIDGVPRLP